MYRKEALESRIKGFSNPVSIRGSLAVHLMLAGIVVVAVGLIAFGLFTDYTRRAVVSGFLRPDSGSVSITATREGQLFIETTNGSLVVEGERLARIVGYDVDATGNSLLELEIQGLVEAKNLVRERLKLTKSQINPLAVQADLSLKQHQRDMASAAELILSRQKQLTITQEAIKRNNTLAKKGLISNASLQDHQRGIITSEQALNEAEDTFASLKAHTEQLKIDWRMREIELQQSINILERDQRNIEGTIAQTQAKRERGLFAPVGGTITYSAAQHGESVSIGTQLFQITPTSSQLQAVLLAPSSAIGFVEVGAVVQIRYSAFPYREHGVFAGTVLLIDDTAQLPSAIRAPVTISEPVYRIVVEVDQAPISKSKKILRIAPGMTLEASIIIDQKPLLLWLLDPLL